MFILYTATLFVFPVTTIYNVDIMIFKMVSY